MAIIPKGKHVKVTRNVLSVREEMTHTISETWTGTLSRDFDSARHYSTIWLGTNVVSLDKDTKVEVMS